MGPAGEEPASRPGAGQRRGPGRTQAGAWSLVRASQSLGLERACRVEAGASCEARRDEGDQVRVGTDLAAELRITQGPPPLVSPLPSRHSPLPGSPGPRCAAPADPKGLASPRPCFEFLTGESERSTTRLSLPFSFFSVLLVPYPKPRTYFPRQSLADGRDLNAARCPAWPQPNRPRPCSGPFILICAVGLGQRAMQPPPNRCLFTLFLLSLFILLLENRERRKVGKE